MNAPPTIHFRDLPLRRVGGLFPLNAPSPDDHHYYQVQPLAGGDKIALENAGFTGLAPGALPAGAFVIGSQAGDADDRIVYNGATGELFFDADGNGAGAAMLFAILDGHPPLAAGDFTVI